MTERADLLARLAEARHAMSDLTRGLNESLEAELDERFARDLELARARVIELEAMLATLQETAGGR